MISETPNYLTRLSRLATRRAFTLIELLVVISIIAILASLAFPAVNGALDSARKARAKNDVTQIATAVVAYETEYGKLPEHSGATVDKSLMDILTGADADKNPRKIVFLEASAWKKGQGGTNSSGAFCDPWDNASVYKIAMDNQSSDATNYDNRIKAGKTPVDLMKKVAVWNEPATDTNRRYVTSW